MDCGTLGRYLADTVYSDAGYVSRGNSVEESYSRYESPEFPPPFPSPMRLHCAGNKDYGVNFHEPHIIHNVSRGSRRTDEMLNVL